MTHACCTPKTTDTSNGEEYTRTGPVYRPGVDIVERADELLLYADMPGVQANSIDIHFEDGQLTIHATVADRYPKDVALLLREYGVGDFHRITQSQFDGKWAAFQLLGQCLPFK